MLTTITFSHAHWPPPCSACSLADSDYEQIFQQLEPWRAAGGIAEAAVEAAHARLDSTTLFEVRAGQLVNVSSWGENRQSVEYWRQVLHELAPLLPDVKLLFNSYDKPRSWVAPLPPAAEAALNSGALDARGAWLRYGCDGTDAGFAALRSRHAAFAPTGVRAQRGPLPVFSGAVIPGCFGGELQGGASAWNGCKQAEDRRVCYHPCITAAQPRRACPPWLPGLPVCLLISCHRDLPLPRRLHTQVGVSAGSAVHGLVVLGGHGPASCADPGLRHSQPSMRGASGVSACRPPRPAHVGQHPC